MPGIKRKMREPIPNEFYIQENLFLKFLNPKLNTYLSNII